MSVLALIPSSSNNLVEVLVTLLVYGIVGGILYYLVTLLPLPEPFKKIVTIAVILLMIVVLLSVFLGGWDGGRIHWD